MKVLTSTGRTNGTAPGQRRQDSAHEARWAAHPVLARALRVTIRLSPVTVAFVVSWQLAKHLPRAVDSRCERTAVIVVGSVVAGVLVERLARRLLPLSALLALTLLFPDRAPSRWKVARQAGRRNPPGMAADADLTDRALALLGNLTSHDRRTRGHAERVRVFSEMLGAELKLSSDDLDRLRWAALLHDIGKLDVSAALLNKPGKPTVTEWDLLRAHPADGARLAGPLVAWLGEWGAGIAEHHERVDGTGYPKGLAGTDISRAGRMLAVVDAYEVMTAARSYKKPMNVGKARLELARCAGSHFDPAVVRAFLGLSLPRLLWTTGPLSFLANLPFLSALQAATRAVPLVVSPAAVAASAVSAGIIVTALPAYASAAPAAATQPVSQSHISVTTHGASAPRPTSSIAASSAVGGTTPAAGGRAATSVTTTVVASPTAAPPRAQPTATASGSPSSQPATPVSPPTAAATPPSVDPSSTAPLLSLPLPLPTPSLIVSTPPPGDGYVVTLLSPLPTKGTSASFTFSSPDGTVYAYQLDGGPWGYVTAAPGKAVTVDFPLVVWGHHTFKVEAVSAQGVPLGPVSSYSWTTTMPL